jgi:hypothetical protein
MSVAGPVPAPLHGPGARILVVEDDRVIADAVVRRGADGGRTVPFDVEIRWRRTALAAATRVLRSLTS